jgi:hypothetical protein
MSMLSCDDIKNQMPQPFLCEARQHRSSTKPSGIQRHISRNDFKHYFCPSEKVKMKTILAAGSFDVFVQKLDPSGNFIWAMSLGSNLGDLGNSSTVDSSGNVYTIGYFRLSADFDPGIGATYLTSVGLDDVFVQKLDSSGNFLWAKSFGGGSNDNGSSITIDVSGNVYTTGSFRGTADFDPGAGTANLTSAGQDDVFVQKLDVSGNFHWAKSFGAGLRDKGNSITVDDSGNVYTTGFFEGTVDFDPGVGIDSHTSAGRFDFFVQKLDDSGNFLWAKSFGSGLFDEGTSITVDASGNVYTTGGFNGTVDFDPGAGTTNLTAVNGDVFVQKLDPSGNFIWAKSFGEISQDRGSSIAVDASGNVYTTGYYAGTVDFDPGAGTVNLTSAGDFDVFVQKLSYCEHSDIDVQAACDSFTWIDGNTYTSSNNSATHTLVTADGCDSIVSLDLTILRSTTGTDVQTACDSYTWIDGNTYTVSNNSVTHILTNAAGCDSVVTLDLTVNYTSTSTLTETSCDQYLSPSGKVFTTSGIHLDTIPNSAGCDSLMTINLTILQSTAASFSAST